MTIDLFDFQNYLRIDIKVYKTILFIDLIYNYIKVFIKEKIKLIRSYKLINNFCVKGINALKLWDFFPIDLIWYLSIVFGLLLQFFANCYSSSSSNEKTGQNDDLFMHSIIIDLFIELFKRFIDSYHNCDIKNAYYA